MYVCLFNNEFIENRYTTNWMTFIHWLIGRACIDGECSNILIEHVAVGSLIIPIKWFYAIINCSEVIRL